METKMEGEETSSWWKSMLIETAKQELELLESKFPNKFEFFKNELKSIIIPFHSDPPASSVATQASTNVMKRRREDATIQNLRRRRSLPNPTDKLKDVRKKKKEEMKSCGLSTPVNKSKGSEDVVVEKMKEDERVEVALERAKACIQKIHELKTQFLIC